MFTLWTRISIYVKYLLLMRFTFFIKPLLYNPFKNSFCKFPSRLEICVYHLPVNSLIFLQKHLTFCLKNTGDSFGKGIKSSSMRNSLLFAYSNVICVYLLGSFLFCFYVSLFCRILSMLYWWFFQSYFSFVIILGKQCDVKKIQL